MSGFLLLIAAVVAWTASAQGEQVYLATHDTWAFYKVRAFGTMTGTNAKTTCTSVGMRYPCYQSGSGPCTTHWTSDCITFDGAGIDVNCRTQWILSGKLCGDTDPRYCQPLDDTFVYRPNWVNGDAWGVDYDTHSYGTDSANGAHYNNKYALCADVDDCASSPCANGTCTDGVASYTCSCENGWTGNNCDQIDDCASSPCAHGTCTDGDASYTCSCENGWTGNNCDQDIDECASNPCWLGGTCLDHVNGYRCVCPKDATGKNCETAFFAGDCYQFSTSAVTHRDATQACSASSGRMVDLRDPQQQQFLANIIANTTGVSNWLAMKTAPLPVFYSDGSPVLAPLQWSVDEVSSPLDLCVFMDSSDNYKANKAFCTEQHNYVCMSALKPCEPNVCQNGGNCTSCFGESIIFCNCLNGFEGLLCETDTDECASNPCQQGGTCQDQVNSYSCRCPTGYDGDNCQNEIDWCSMVTCPFDWTCQNLVTHFSCLAPTVRKLQPYKCSSASCPADMYCKEEGDASFSCWAK
ncbi:PREDICTED: neurogenic locus notch homolog protein 1-like [Branchiostoma belcheri]|uniref:Neurogenic locus notch homolog protein 1-like n=1 Tax=Branchiostoma belcheri TaxID=7741 RepID=A0A6P4Y2R8_BRABE|nr:PREDICTED: neurogenic locus notch homolog protein 1-like [Branchiostoma belcheri]